MRKITKKTTRTRHGILTTIIKEELEAAKPVAQTASPLAPPAPPAPPPPQLTNEVHFVLDDSGSMQGCYTEALRQLNLNLERVREQARATGQRTLVSLYIFSSSVRTIFSRVPIEDVKPVVTPRPEWGMTALASAMCKSLDDSLAAPDANDPNKSYLIVVVTDGGENQSWRGDVTRLPALIQRAQQTDRWTLACMVPRGGKYAMERLGVPAGNITEWTNDVAGAQQGFQATSQGVSAYYNTRSKGGTSTKQFYTTDLSKVTAADLSKMEDVSHRFKKWEITKAGEDIKPFVESKGYRFVIGAGYYLLMKKELLRKGRNVLVMEKGSNRVFGGKDARTILGIPDGEVYVTPGNHANYDVYFQSTSTNRKLTHGTKLYWDLTKITDDQETWDSEGAKKAAEAKKTAAAAQPVV